MYQKSISTCHILVCLVCVSILNVTKSAPLALTNTSTASAAGLRSHKEETTFSLLSPLNQKTDTFLDKDQSSTTTVKQQSDLTDDTGRRSKSRKKKRDRNKKRDKGVDGECDEKSEMELKDMLGPAFNGRYMSVEKPVEADISILEELLPQNDGAMADDSGTDNLAIRTVPFHVSSNYSRELPPDFYLDITWYQEVIHSLSDSAALLLRRMRRAAETSGISPDENTLPWLCESEIIWTDLGSNYYPRFLRNVRCTRDKCWFGHFTCKPKAFTVNVLKRVKDSCKDDSEGHDWVYEERAVTFCCECIEY